MEQFDDSHLLRPYQYRVGDIVLESEWINPHERSCWIGIVVYIERGYYEFEIVADVREDLIAVHWFQPNMIETLPSSVIKLVHPMPIKKAAPT